MKTIKELHDDAIAREIPIMKDDGIAYLYDFLQKHNIKNVLEIGSAIGFSSICMAMSKDDIHITTIEKDEERYQEAIQNIKDFGKENQITCLNMDALEYIPDRLYDLLFIDAAKSSNGRFFDRFTPYLINGGYVIVDNMYFYGFVDDIGQVRTKNLRQLVQKIQKFKTYIMEHPDYESVYLQTGDGIIIAQKKVSVEE